MAFKHPSQTEGKNMDQQIPHKRTYRKHEEWRQLINKFEAGDLSTTEFCAKHGIASSGLYNWRKKFQQEHAAAQESAFIELPQIAMDEPLPHNSSDRWDVELELGNDVILRLRKA